MKNELLILILILITITSCKPTTKIQSIEKGKLSEAEITKIANKINSDLVWSNKKGNFYVQYKNEKPILLDINKIKEDCNNDILICESVLESVVHSKRIPIIHNIKKIRVTNYMDFLHAIRPNRHIYLDIDKIEMQFGVDQDRSKELKFRNPFISAGILGNWINNVTNITIEGRPTGTILIHGFDGSDILYFTNVQHLTLKNIRVTHKSPYLCQGGVVKIENSNNIIINNSIFDGSGVIGLNLKNIKDAIITKSKFENNSWSAIEISDSSNIRFIDSLISKNNVGNGLIEITDSVVKFSNTKIIKNESSINLIEIKGSTVEFSGLEIRNNRFKNIFNRIKPNLTKMIKIDNEKIK